MGKFFLPKATTAERTGLTPDDGTILYDETEQMLYFGDGSTAGGNTLQGDIGPQGPPGTLTAVVDDTSPQLGGFLDPNGNYVGMDQGGNLASASPLVIGTDGDYYDVTGTTGFATMTVAANRFFILQFDSALVVTHGGAITIPGGLNFTTSTGDQLLCFSTAPNTVRILTVTKADGTPVAIDVLADTSPQLGGFLDPNDNYIGSNKGGDLASASPLVLGIDGDYYDITGTTGFSSITVANNRRFRLQFDGVLAITVGAGITLNNAGSNFTTAPGDIIDFQSVATDVVVGTITKADGKSPVSAGASWILIGTVTASASPSLTVTGLNTATYDTFAFAWANMIPASNNVSFQMRVGDAGGIDSGATDYAYHSTNVTVASSTYSASVNAGTTNIGIALNVTTADGIGGTGFITPSISEGPTITGDFLHKNASAAYHGGPFRGIRLAAISLDRIQVLFSSGNITSGRLTVWGIAHT